MQLKMKSKNSPCMPNQYFFCFKGYVSHFIMQKQKPLITFVVKAIFFFIDKGKIVILLFQSTMLINL